MGKPLCQTSAGSQFSLRSMFAWTSAVAVLAAAYRLNGALGIATPLFLMLGAATICFGLRSGREYTIATLVMLGIALAQIGVLSLVFWLRLLIELSQ
jgi:hypothetical protein